MAKIGKNGHKKGIIDIKNLCFLHHTSPKSCLEYSPNQFLAKKLSRLGNFCSGPVGRPKKAKYGQKQPF